MNMLERYLKLTVEKEEMLYHRRDRIDKSLPFLERIYLEKEWLDEYKDITNQIQELKEILQRIIGEQLSSMQTYYGMYHFFDGYSHEQSMEFLKQGSDHYAGVPYRKGKSKLARKKAEQLKQQRQGDVKAFSEKRKRI